MISRFDGHCSNLGWPGLTDGSRRPCSFYEYINLSLDNLFWPYTFWQALIVGAIFVLLFSGLVSLIAGIYYKKNNSKRLMAK